MTQLTRNLGRLAAALVIVTTLGCKEATAPDATLAEAYDATTFIIQTNAGPVDLLEEGAMLSLFFHEGGSATGYLFVPDADPAGGDLSEDLNGTWSVSADQVTLTTDSETFLQSAVLRVESGQLIYEVQGVLVTLSPAD